MPPLVASTTEFLVYFAGLLACLLIVIYTVRTGISPMPSSRKARHLMMEQVPPEFDGTIYELGAGWGSLAFPFSKAFPKATIHAFELSPLPYLFCQLRSLITPSGAVHLYRKNFLNVNLSDADIVICYLYPEAMATLQSKFEKELPKGALVITNTFTLPTWPPIAQTELSPGSPFHVSTYKKT